MPPPSARRRTSKLHCPRSHVRGTSCSSLTDKTALVTGATGGIGGAIARALHKQGAIVAVSGRQKDKLEKLAAELGSRVHVLPCDLADKAQVANLIDQAIANAGSSRYPRQQRRPHQRQSVHGDEGRTVGRGDSRQPHLHVHADARSGAGHDAGQDGLWAHRQHLLRERYCRQSRAGQLCSLQGRHDRHVEVACP